MITKSRIRTLMETVGFEYMKKGLMYHRGDLRRKPQILTLTLTWNNLAQIAIVAGIQELPLFDGYLWKTFEWLENKISPGNGRVTPIGDVSPFV